MELLVSSLLPYFSLLENQHSVGVLHEVQRVSDQKHCLCFQVTFYGFVENEGSNVRIDCAENVIQNINVCVAVKGPRQSNPRLLSSRKSRPFFPDHSVLSFGEYRQIVGQRRVSYGLVVLSLFVGLPEKNVVSDGFVHEPRDLRAVSHRSTDIDLGFGSAFHLSEERVGERGLSAGVGADY